MKKVYRVTATYDEVFVAHDEQDAEHLFKRYLASGEYQGDIEASEILSKAGLPASWDLACIPYSEDKLEERSIQEWLDRPVHRAVKVVATEEQVRDLRIMAINLGIEWVE